MKLLVSRLSLALLTVLLATSSAFADTSIVGALNPNDPNDGLLVTFMLSSATTVTMQSYGFGGSANAPGGTNAAGTVINAGGFDTYMSLFLGSGNSATFLTSNDDGLCPPGDDTEACRDSTLSPLLAAGTYTLAVTAFDNFSFAENLGSGTLGDGFIGLGSYFNLDCFCDRSSDYAIDILASGLTVTDITTISSIPAPVPEPGTIILFGSSLVSVVMRARKKY